MDFIFQIQDTIRAVKTVSPKTVNVFSIVIPHLVWLNSYIFSVFEKIRKIIRRIEKFMCLGYGTSFRHVDLEGGVQGLYRKDGIHLSDIGLDIMKLNFRHQLNRTRAGCVRQEADYGTIYY